MRFLSKYRVLVNILNRLVRLIVNVLLLTKWPLRLGLRISGAPIHPLVLHKNVRRRKV